MFQKSGGKIIGFAHYLEVTQKDEVNSNHWIQILVFLSINIAQQRQNSCFLML